MDAVTHAEARYLLKFKSLDRLRAALAAGVPAAQGGRGPGGAEAQPADAGQAAADAVGIPASLEAAQNLGYRLTPTGTKPHKRAAGFDFHKFAVVSPHGYDFEVGVTLRSGAAPDVVAARAEIADKIARGIKPGAKPQPAPDDDWVGSAATRWGWRRPRPGRMGRSCASSATTRPATRWVFVDEAGRR